MTVQLGKVNYSVNMNIRGSFHCCSINQVVRSLVSYEFAEIDLLYTIMPCIGHVTTLIRMHIWHFAQLRMPFKPYMLQPSAPVKISMVNLKERSQSPLIC